jgi:hypothetical protein
MVASYAGQLRPVLDRVYATARIAGRDRVRSVYHELGLRPGLELDFYCGLLQRPMPADAYAAVTTYDRLDPARALDQGTATVDAEGTWRLTATGRELALAVQRAVGEGAEELWSRRPIATMPGLTVLPRLIDLVGRLLEAGHATGGPAFRALAPVYEPDDASPAVRLTTRLGALRHHRADAHRSAWRDAGLTVEEISALPDGPRRRAVEDETNCLDEPIYAALTTDERLELIASLGALSG